jgi:hypothetical protein
MQNREGIRERNRRIGRSLNRPAVGAYRGRYSGPAIFDAELYPHAGLADHGAALPPTDKAALDSATWSLQTRCLTEEATATLSRISPAVKSQIICERELAICEALGALVVLSPSLSYFRSSCGRSACIGARADFRAKVHLHHAFLQDAASVSV